MSEHPELREETIDALLGAYDNPMVEEIAHVLHGFHEVAAKPSHRPEAVRELFCDANASMALAAAVYLHVVEPAVGKLQAELAEARARLAEADKAAGDVIETSHDAVESRHPDPERIRREAIGASILEFIARHPLLRTSFWPVNAALAAGESAVTGEASDDPPMTLWRGTVGRAVTGEQAQP